MDNIFDIAHADALKLIEDENVRCFLVNQRKPGRSGRLINLGTSITQKKTSEICDKDGQLKILTTPETICSLTQTKDSNLNTIVEVLDCPESQFKKNEIASEKFSDTSQSISREVYEAEVLFDSSDSSSEEEILVKRGSKHFITPKLVATLDRCQLSTRDAVYVLQATAEALGQNTDELVINKSSINRIRRTKRRERAEAMKDLFKNMPPEFVTVHWDGKLLPALNVRDSKEERLPIVITYGDCEKIIAVPKLKNSSGKEQALAVHNGLVDWNVEDKVQFLCFDTTASNTGRFNGACVLLEQKMNRELFYLPCRHHIYELVLRSVFEAKICQSVNSPNIPLFEQFKENWKNINCNNIENGRKWIGKYSTTAEISELLIFFKEKLAENGIRSDYRELIELSILFLGGDVEKKLKIHPPGAMHQARWMARSIYCLKIFLLKSQLTLCNEKKKALTYVCIFIVKLFVKPWINCSDVIRAPYQDLSFLKSLKNFENIDKIISNAATKKFSTHLWYLSDDMTPFSLFDDNVSVETKVQMVKNLDKEYQGTDKRYIPTDGDQIFGRFINFNIYNSQP